MADDERALAPSRPMARVMYDAGYEAAVRHIVAWLEDPDCPDWCSPSESERATLLVAAAWIKDGAHAP